MSKEKTTELKTYNLLEVAEILSLNRRTLYNYIKDGKLKAVKIGSVWRVTHSELERILNSR